MNKTPHKNNTKERLERSISTILLWCFTLGSIILSVIALSKALSVSDSSNQSVTVSDVENMLANYVTKDNFSSGLTEYIKNDDAISITGINKCCIIGDEGEDCPNEHSCSETGSKCNRKLSCAFKENPTSSDNINAIFTYENTSGTQLKINKG